VVRQGRGGLRPSRRRQDLERSGPFLGLGGIAVAAFLYGYTAVAFPGLVHSLVMPLVWLAFFALTCAWFTRRPVAVAAVPVVAVVVWFALLWWAG
jgi:hypothetical protein